MRFLKAIAFIGLLVLLSILFVKDTKSAQKSTCEDYDWEPYYNFTIEFHNGYYTAYDEWGEKIFGPKRKMKRWNQNNIEWVDWSYETVGRKSYTTKYWGDKSVCLNEYGQIKIFDISYDSEKKLTGVDPPDRDGGRDR